MKRTAFTLIEILIVVILLGILAAIVIPQFSESTEEANRSACQSNMQAARTQIQLYKFRSGGTVPTLPQLVTAGYLQSTPACPAGGTYTVDGEGRITCSVEGH